MARTSNIFVTVDMVVTKASGPTRYLLLIRRKNEPFKGQWALPGGFVDDEEDLPDAARRELMEETGVAVSEVVQLGAFGKPGRDPRHRTVSVVFMAKADESASPVAGDDAENAQWFPVDHLPQLAFDHAEIIAKALGYEG